MSAFKLGLIFVAAIVLGLGSAFVLKKYMLVTKTDQFDTQPTNETTTDVGQSIGPQGIQENKNELPADRPPPASFSHIKGPKPLFKVPRFSMLDSGGQWFTDNHLRGKLSVVNFVFKKCTSTCPMIMAKTAQLVMKHQDSEFFQALSITVDPTNDTQKELATWKKSLSEPTSPWHFLRSDRESTYRLIREGFKIPVEDSDSVDMPIAHSSALVIVDPTGWVRGVYDSNEREELARLEKSLIAIRSEFIVVPPIDPTLLAQKKQWLKDIRTKMNFKDALVKSGITFKHAPVPDATYNHKPVHYDHGNGVAAADVNGDGLTDLYFVNQIGPNQLWLGTVTGQFRDGTQRSGLAVNDRVSIGASFADLDNDGDQDLYVTTVRQGNLLFLNEGNGTFRDVTRQSGLGYQGHSSGATFFDYNNDGLLDLFLSNVGTYSTPNNIPAIVTDELPEPPAQASYYLGRKEAFAAHLKPNLSESSRLFKNGGNMVFEDVTNVMGIDAPGWNGDAVVLDRNKDGFADIYLLNMQGSDQYLENIDGKKFLDRTKDFFPQAPWGTMGGVLVDADGDGSQELFVTDMHSDMMTQWLFKEIQDENKKLPLNKPLGFMIEPDRMILGNALFKFSQNGTQEISDIQNAENYWPWGVSAGDFDADGLEDLYITSSMNYPFRYATSSLLMNRGTSGFEHGEFAAGLEPRPHNNHYKPWFVRDCKQSDKKDCPGRDDSLLVLGARGTRSAVILDLDQDGDLDIVTSEFFDVPRILYSDLAQKHPQLSFLKISLRGHKSNRDGLGAVVTVETKSRQQTRFHNGKSGYLSQSNLPLYFGLGHDKSVESIIVKWPGGSTQTLNGPIGVNQTLVIEEKLVPTH